MTTTTTLSAMRHLLHDSGRFDRLPTSGGDDAFSALISQGADAAKEWNVPTPVPTDLRNRFWAEGPTPPPSTDFIDEPAPTPVPTNPEDELAPTPVPTVAPEDPAALTNRLVYSLLTGTEFELAVTPLGAESEG